MPLAVLSIDLEAKLAGLQQGLDKAGRIAERNAQQIERSFSGIRTAAATLGGVIAGAFSGLSAGALTQFVLSTVDAIDKLNDAADATGATVENLSALEDVARKNGESLDTVTAALVKFNASLKEADGKNGPSIALKAIGLDAEKLKRIDPAEALRQTAVALAGFADDGNKARLVQELFGKSVREVGPFLKDLSEQTELIATRTKAQAEAAERFNKQLFELQTNASNLARDLAGPLVSAINDTVEKFKEGAAAGKGFFQILREEQLKLLGIRLDTKISTDLDRIAALNKVLKEGNIDLERRLRIERQLAGLQLRVDTALGSNDPRELARRGRLPTIGSGGDRPSVGSLPTGTGGKSALQQYIERLEAATIASLDLSNEEQARIAITNGELGKLTKAQEEYILLLAKGIDLNKQQIAAPFDFRRSEIRDTEEVNKALAARELEEFNRAREHFNALIAAGSGEKLKEEQKDMLLLAKAYEEGRISVEQYVDAVQARLGNLPKDIQPALSAMDEFTKQAARNIQDALGDTIADTLKGNFDDIGQKWKNLLIDMAAQAAAAQIGRFLFGDMGKTGWGAAGSVLGALFGGFFADGGTLGAGKWGIAGEKGPELIKGPATIVPMKQGSGVTVVQNISIGAGVNRNELLSAMSFTQQSTINAIAEANRRGNPAFAR